jgi:hypothetical protein
MQSVADDVAHELFRREVDAMNALLRHPLFVSPTAPPAPPVES